MDSPQPDNLQEELRAIRRELRISRITNICTAALLLAIVALMLGGREGLFGTVLFSGFAAVCVLLWRDHSAKGRAPRPSARVVLPPTVPDKF
jgi:uncharacterized membrane protein YjjP (DUF1212 family)